MLEPTYCEVGGQEPENDGYGSRHLSLTPSDPESKRPVQGMQSEGPVSLNNQPNCPDWGGVCGFICFPYLVCLSLSCYNIVWGALFPTVPEAGKPKIEMLVNSGLAKVRFLV